MRIALPSAPRPPLAIAKALEDFGKEVVMAAHSTMA
jgi:hypothetical protein